MNRPGVAIAVAIAVGIMVGAWFFYIWKYWTLIAIVLAALSVIGGVRFLPWDRGLFWNSLSLGIFAGLLVSTFLWGALAIWG
jgi:hypothetical protein